MINATLTCVNRDHVLGADMKVAQWKWLLMKNLRNQNGNDPGKIITFSSYSLVQNRWVLTLAHRQTDGFAASVTCSGDFRMSLVAFLCSIRGRRRVTSMNNTLFTPKFKHVF